MNHVIAKQERTRNSIDFFDKTFGAYDFFSNFAPANKALRPCFSHSEALASAKKKGILLTL